ncbi:BspA family leucine-rich repeat surface protein [Candidatus Saccharibacteria bacterium]|nr:BspA family leucine-rich repeat surface protein [Candidatus Saccharibacteria bacterium]
MKSMFENASSLADIYGLANWGTVKVSNICRMFSSDLSISNLSMITNWNVSNVTATL